MVPPPLAAARRAMGLAAQKPKSPLRVYIVERYNSVRNGGSRRARKCAIFPVR